MSVISETNDVMRTTLSGCRVVMTLGVATLDDSVRVQLIDAVRAFNSFGPDNDPWEEHDFGKIHLAGEDFFWKFDYFDDNFEFFKENGNRVLTIMRADEY